METKTIELLYGKAGISVRVPADAAVLQSGPIPRLPNPAEAIRQGLARPTGTSPLLDLLKGKKPASIAITISDLTRPVPNQLIVPALLDIIHTAGLRDDQVTIIVGTGLHRPTTDAEKRELLGDEILRRCRVVDHRGDAPETLMKVCDQPAVLINADFARAEFRIVTGLIEPHFMAGFSGGRKGVCPALADQATVLRFHSPAILGDPRSANGVLEGNPTHCESLRVARLVGVDFLVNVAIDRGRRLAGVYCGDMEKAHEAGCADVGRWNRANGDSHGETFDLVVTNGGGYPLDQTFYQSVKGIVGALPALNENSILLVVSHCGEGIGSPSFTGTMARWGGDWRGFLAHIANSPVVKDQWQYQMQTRVLERIGPERIWFVSDGLPADKQVNLAVAPIVGEGDAQSRCQRAIDGYLRGHPAARVAVIPEGPYALLVQADKAEESLPQRSQRAQRENRRTIQGAG